MDEKLKNLIRTRDAKLGWVMFWILIVLLLINNRFAFPVMDRANSEVKRFLANAMGGIIVGQAFLLVTWTILRAKPLFNRLQFWFCATMALLAAWMLGYFSRFRTDIGINLQSHEEFYFVAWILPVFVVASIPFVALRFFGWQVIASIYEPEAPARNPISTAGLMTLTGVIATSIAAIELPSLARMDQADIWVAFGFVAAFVLGGSLLIFLPSTLLLLSRYRSFFIWSFGVVATVLVISTLVAFFIANNRMFGLRINRVADPVAFVGSAVMVFTFGIATMRLFGYRLMKAVVGEMKYGKKTMQ